MEQREDDGEGEGESTAGSLDLIPAKVVREAIHAPGSELPSPGRGSCSSLPSSAMEALSGGKPSLTQGRAGKGACVIDVRAGCGTIQALARPACREVAPSKPMKGGPGPLQGLLRTLLLAPLAIAGTVAVHVLHQQRRG
jgi:hypothetical protein